MRVAQILYDKAHWIFNPLETFGKDEMPKLPPDPEGKPIVLVDVTDKPEVSIGWDYDTETGIFTEPEIVIPDPPSEPEPIPPSPTEQKLTALQAENETLMLALAEQFEKQLTVEANQQTIMLALADLYETNTNAV